MSTKPEGGFRGVRWVTRRTASTGVSCAGPDAGGEEWARALAPAAERPRISAEFPAEERRTPADGRYRQELFRAEGFDAAVDWGLEPLLGEGEAAG